MSALLVGYARCSTDQQDLTTQRDGLLILGVEAERIYVDHGLTGTNRERPGLREALAACRAGDTLVVTKLDRLARSLPDARAIADELTTREISLSLGGSVYDPTDAVGRLLFNVLAMVAEFESDLIRLRTVEGMKVAKAKGRLKGKQPKLSRISRKRTWSRWCTAASTAPSRSPSSSASAGPPFTGRSSGSARLRRQDSLTLHDADLARCRRPATDTLAGRRRAKLPCSRPRALHPDNGPLTESPRSPLRRAGRKGDATVDCRTLVAARAAFGRSFRARRVGPGDEPASSR